MSALSRDTTVPKDILASLERLHVTNGDRYMPQLLMAWKDGADGARIAGRLRWDGTTVVTRTEQTIGVMFGDFLGYATARFIGTLADSADTRLCHLHGLTHAMIETDVDGANLRTLSLDDESVRRSPSSLADDPSARFLDAHRTYLRQLAEEFDTHIWRPS